MIINAHILRRDTPAAPDPSGQVTYVNGADEHLPIFLGEVMRGQRIALEGRLQGASSVAYVNSSLLGGIAPRARERWTIEFPYPASAGQVALVREVVMTTYHAKEGGLSHFAVFLVVPQGGV